MESPDAATDGGWGARSGRAQSERVEVDLEDTSGAGALSGLVAGGALGTPFGPAGVLIGGVVGGLLGNAVEYRNLEREQQERLRRSVADFLDRHTRPGVRIETFGGVTEGTDDDGDDFWQFGFRDRRGRTHAARLDPDAERVVLVE